MDLLRTPDTRFEGLPDWPYAPNYLELDGVRVHWVDEGPRDAPPVILLHGEPSWAYLYRRVIPPLVAAGLRVLAPDLVGFGRSDKPARQRDHSYARHVAWMTRWWLELDLAPATFVLQDWGGLIGLRLVAAHPERVAAVVAANTLLPTGEGRPPLAFRVWRAASQLTPVFPAGRIVQFGSVRGLSRAEVAAYDAPFPSARYQAGARALPRLVPTSPEHDEVTANRDAWRRLAAFERPFVTAFGARDPILGDFDRLFQERVAGARGQPHRRFEAAGHFLQEDVPAELAEVAIDTARQAHAAG